MKLYTDALLKVKAASFTQQVYCWMHIPLFFCVDVFDMFWMIMLGVSPFEEPKNYEVKQ